MKEIVAKIWSRPWLFNQKKTGNGWAKTYSGEKAKEEMVFLRTYLFSKNFDWTAGGERNFNFYYINQVAKETEAIKMFKMTREIDKGDNHER